MNSKTQDQSHLDLAVQEVASFLRLLAPCKDSSYVVNMLMKKTVERFTTQLSRIESIRILEIADWEFEVTANGHAKATLLIERKGAGNG